MSDDTPDDSPGEIPDDVLDDALGFDPDALLDLASDEGVEVRNVKRERRRRSGDGTYEAVEVAVPVEEPRSVTDDSYVDADVIVGEIPVTDADTPCADDRLDATAVTVLDDRVTAYYPRGGETVALVWDAATDDWRCEEVESEGAFESGRDDETVLWKREER